MANCLYGPDKVELPDIYKVYTPELQEKYPYAVIHQYTSGKYFLYCLPKEGVYNKDPIGICWGILFTGRFYYYSAELTDGAWVGSVKEHTSFMIIPTSKVVNGAIEGVIIWSNFEILDKDGGIYMEKSPDPIPVGGEPIDKTSFLQGWLVGRRLAGMRK